MISKMPLPFHRSIAGIIGTHSGRGWVGTGLLHCTNQMSAFKGRAPSLQSGLSDHGIEQPVPAQAM